MAATFGYRSGPGALRAAERSRDRVFPVDLAHSVEHEYWLAESLALAVTRSVNRRSSNARLLRSTDLVIWGGKVSLRLAAGAQAARRAAADPAWVDLHTADLGAWTPELQQRADGWSFHEIAQRVGLDDWFDAARLVATSLLRYEQGCASRLRARQIAALDRDFHDASRQVTRTSVVDLDAASRAYTILDQRLDVLGIGMPYPGPLIDHPPTVRRAVTPSPTWKANPRRVRSAGRSGRP
jgi:hypothetical protein